MVYVLYQTSKKVLHYIFITFSTNGLTKGSLCPKSYLFKAVIGSFLAMNPGGAAQSNSNNRLTFRPAGFKFLLPEKGHKG